MDISVFQAAAAMNASTRWQEIISDNLAASQIPGFKRQETSFSAVQAGLMGRAPGSAQRFAMPLAGASINFQPGELRPTGVATDLSVEGPGFFEVEMPDGRRGYTRDGEFHVDAQGRLLSKEGFSVIGDTGPIQLDTSIPTPMTIAPTGEISQGSINKGRLKLSEFADPAALTQTGTGLFLAVDPAAQPRPAATSLVRQGFLEESNISTMTEMGNLITSMRLFEANQKMLQTEDDRVSKLINEVGNPA